MSARNLSSMRQAVKQILRDEFEVGGEANEEWQPDELDVYFAECLFPISRAFPRIVKEVKTTIADSKVIDISDIEDLIAGPWSIQKAEYPTGYATPYYRNIEVIDESQIKILANRTFSAGASSTLTGTVTFPSSGAAVTGSDTAFSTELSAGYHIRKAVSGSSGRWYRVYSITDDTNLTLAEPVTSGDSGEDDEDATEYCYETAYLFCEKLHTLNEDTSTLYPALEEILIYGV